MNVIEQCTEYKEVRKVCIAEEKGKMYRLINISGFEVRKVKVDKCFPQEMYGKRCDYLMSVENENLLRAIFVELKGGSLTDALQQLYETILHLKNEFNNFQIDARVVGSRDVPGFINTSHYKKLAREILPTSGTIKRATNRIFSENI